MFESVVQNGYCQFTVSGYWLIVLITSRSILFGSYNFAELPAVIDLKNNQFFNKFICIKTYLKSIVRSYIIFIDE